MSNQERISQLLRFFVVGGSVAIIDLATVWLTSHLLPALLAVSLGYVTGVSCHFLLNKFWVFKCGSRQYRRQVTLYLLHVALYWLMTMLLVSLVLSVSAANVVVARMISIPPMTLFTFCFLRFLIFNKAGGQSESIALPRLHHNCEIDELGGWTSERPRFQLISSQTYDIVGRNVLRNEDEL
ncbi:MAG: GtrA family protein [Verrucomicrobia bacterium]|nr:GtrA family protein [Verrucomicrobiota bacterium]